MRSDLQGVIWTVCKPSDMDISSESHVDKSSMAHNPCLAPAIKCPLCLEGHAKGSDSKSQKGHRRAQLMDDRDGNSHCMERWTMGAEITLAQSILMG